MYLKSRNANMVGSVLVLRDQGSDGESNVPIAAIVGGTLGGVMLAILAVIGWKLWGRSIRRQAEADRKRKLEAMKAKERKLSNTTIPQENIEKMTQTGYLPPPSRSRSNSADSSKKVPYMSKEGHREALPNSTSSSSSRKPVSHNSQRPDAPSVSRPRPIRPGSGSQNQPHRKQRKEIPPVPPLPTNLAKMSSPMHYPASDQTKISATKTIKTTNHERLEIVNEGSAITGDADATPGSSSSRALRRVGSLTTEQRASVASKNSGSERSATSSRRWSWRFLLNNTAFSFRQSGYERNRLSEATTSMRSWRGRDENMQVPVGVAYGGNDEIEYPQAYIDFAEGQNATQSSDHKTSERN